MKWLRDSYPIREWGNPPIPVDIKNQIYITKGYVLASDALQILMVLCWTPSEADKS